MINQNEEDLINLVHYYLLKCRSSEDIMSALEISGEELIRFINIINSYNNQTIHFKVIEKVPHIIYSKREYKIHNLYFPQNKLKLMIVSDKHIGHSEDSIKYINNVYEEATRRGINYVFDLGDILNGPSTKVHNPSKICAGDLESSLERLKAYHPTNIPTYFITGNHDLKFMENDSCDIGRTIAQECPNMIFLNNLFTCINIGGLRINLSHGSIENKKLSEIKINKELRFLRLNDPHIICQGHFHVGGDPIGDYPLLCQVPSLKTCDTNLKTKNSDYYAGALFLTIKDFSDAYEVQYEKQEFVEIKSLIKKEISIEKRRIDFWK